MKLRQLLPALLCIVTGGTLLADPHPESFERLLKNLDGELRSSNKYVEARYRRIRFLLDMKTGIGASREQEYQLNRKLYDEYFPFKFDSALYYLTDNLRVAQSLGDKRRSAETLVELGLLYTTSGMYLEAREVLTRQIDTQSMSREQMTHYYWVQQRFYRDFHEYSKHSEMTETATRKLCFYRTRLFETLDPDSEEYLSLRVSQALDDRQMELADSINRILLSRHTPESHPYAMHTYNQALIDYALGREDFGEWYTRSAISDVLTATKDNASIASLARLLFEEQDIERAFRYILISMDDAIFYNAKLRPWQIAQIMPIIEKSYTKHNLSTQRTQRLMTLLIGIAAVIILLFALYAYVMFRRARRAAVEIHRKNTQISTINEELSQMNSRLRELNTSIAEANGVKEEYIGLLLSMCSNYIEKMLSLQRNVKRKLSAGKGSELQKELSSTALMDAELEDFYNMFDSAFLRLYPDFVEEFNSLLKDDERILLHKGEMLNTELRIFALIRLGITDSSKIAALLRYSVNTIYNYRAKVKNKARGGRDDFEDMIKTIGSFKS